jgi:hypothetical protein
MHPLVKKMILATSVSTSSRPISLRLQLDFYKRRLPLIFSLNCLYKLISPSTCYIVWNAYSKSYNLSPNKYTLFRCHIFGNYYYYFLVRCNNLVRSSYVVVVKREGRFHFIFPPLTRYVSYLFSFDRTPRLLRPAQNVILEVI